ncbi:T9SS type A sorting domain-containing protein, partial [bacterium]|nr:T9SS type A sorting domain-containing protein [bacterium]
GGGFFASWLNEWEYDNPWFWGEAGAGPVALSFASGDSFRICGNSFFGPWPEEGLSVDVFGSESDSDIVLICGDYSGITFSRPLWNNNTGFGIQELHFIFRGARSVGALFTEGDVLFLVSRSFTTRPAELLRIDNLSACTVVQTLNDEPIIAASHPDFGIAWLARYGTGLVLYRADTTGAPVFPAGAIHWPSEGHEIVEAALSLSDDGLLVAAWTERETGYDQPTILRIASVGWDTYLEVEESRFILHPSSFILSAFPNPFNSVLQIEYELAHSSELDLAVYNLIGQRVETLQHGVQEAGTYRATWLPKSAGGIYFVTLTTDAASRTAKVLYLR